MSGLDRDSKNMLVGAIIGGAIGIGAASMFFSSRKNHKEQKSPLGISKSINHVEEVLKNHDIDGIQSKVHEFGKKVEKTEHKIFDVLEWAVDGIALWNKLKK